MIPQSSQAHILASEVSNAPSITTPPFYLTSSQNFSSWDLFTTKSLWNHNGFHLCSIKYIHKYKLWRNIYIYICIHLSHCTFKMLTVKTKYESTHSLNCQSNYVITHSVPLESSPAELWKNWHEKYSWHHILPEDFRLPGIEITIWKIFWPRVCALFSETKQKYQWTASILWLQAL